MSKIIVDCSREENYSVAILDKAGNLDYFSFENNVKNTIKGNIYLGRITRVEYSLQAAFVEYGGDKAGFLPFGEIHPNYYNLPKADKEKLANFLREEEEINKNDENDENDAENGDDYTDEAKHERELEREKASYTYNLYKKYSIQEVIKRGQTVLVQVTKDERGNKGVSLSTYISLAGRYCVLMPNSPRGIGVSRKIASYEERKKIINTIHSWDLPSGIGLIIRTAGISARPEDLKRDYKYLCNLWDEICKRAVHLSVGKEAVYEEVDVAKQAIRDYYSSDGDANAVIYVSGKKGFDDISSYVKKLMPHEANKVKLYMENMAIFKRFGIDKKIDELLSPIAPLKSGGYLVINPTEALISIDVNSGKSIHGRNVEDTALQTNLEAAAEVARQLRLRNLGGLIVVDFIDMDDPRNRRTLERELQRVFMFDKAKVQIARISQFGLVEISRQRMRSNIQEMLTVPCDCCNGTGLMKAPSVVSINILDSIKEQLANPNYVKKEFLEVMACKNVLDHLVVANIKEIQEIERKHNIKIITTKHNFEKNTEYILRSVDSIGNSETAVELYHELAAKFVVATQERKKTNPLMRFIGKFLRKHRK